MSSSCLNAPDTVHLRITMPEYPDVQKVMPFSPDDTIWTVKQRFLQNLKKDLIDSQNYGLYIPPASCRSGKFLDEERCLREYPLTGAIKYFEQTQFKYKNRIKFSFDISSMKLKKVNTLFNQKEFIEWVLRGEGDKIARLLNKGFNPNYNHIGNGETLLTLATTLSRPRSMLISLVSGGAFLDYRNKNGQTPLHTAVIHKNKDAMRTLLDLGSSPNYKDKDNLTPLFLSCMNNNNLQLISMLLHERAQLQCRDRHGYTELHQACKHGNKDLVEQLVFYGSDLNSQDHNGDTPLHICASSNNRDCCEVLLIRGADKNITNNNGKTAGKLSHYTSNPQLIRLIEDFKTEDIVYFEDLPVYNDKRRGDLSAATIRSLEKSRSNPNLHLLFANQPSSTISAASLNTLANQSTTNVTKNYTSGYSIPNGTNIRSRPNDKRLSAMELEWSANTKDQRVLNVKKETFQTLFEEKSFLLKVSEKGLGFSIKNLEPVNEENPCRQVFNEVYEGKAAADAGLKAGDYLYEINGKKVRDASHDDCVNLVKSANKSIQIKVLRKISVKEDKPIVTENKDSFTNPVHFNNKNSLKDQVETSTDLKVSKNSGNILKNNYTESKAVLENNQPEKYDGQTLTTTAKSTSTNTTSTTLNSFLKPQLSTTDLQNTVPVAPPLPPDIETLRKIKAREMPNLVESVSNDRRSQTNTLKKIDVNSPLPNAAHNDLFEAIKRRKQLVDDVGSDNLSASIESKVNQSKKLNSLTKTSVIALNKEKSKHKSFVPQSAINQQNYGLLATESKTLGKPPKSPQSKDRNSVYQTSNKTQSEYSPIYEAKTLPKIGTKEQLESEQKEGFSADAERLRLMFIEKKFNTIKNKKSPEIKEENNFINSNLMTDSTNKKKVVLSKPSEKQEQTVVETYVEPSPIINNNLDTINPVLKHKEPINNNENKENNVKEKETKEINSLQKVNPKMEKPKLALEATLSNGIQKEPPSPSMGALATIVAEKAQQIQESNRQIQEPSSGTSRIFSAGNTLTKNNSSSSPASPKKAEIKPLSAFYTSQTPPTPKIPIDKPLAKPTSVSAVNLSTNKKVYTSVTKTSPSPPSKAPISSIGNNQEKSFKSAKSVFQSSNVSTVNKNYNESNKPPLSKLIIQNKSNNITSNSKAFVRPKSPPATPPKTFLNNNIAIPSKVYSSKTNGIHSNIENKHVSNMTANYNGTAKKTKSSTNFIKSYSDTTDAAIKQSDFKEVQVTPSKVLTPVSPKVSTSPETAFPTLRKKPQQTNTLVFKAKPNSTPNSPPSRKI